jgi:hypothetical protein
MLQGQLLCCDTPDRVRNDPRVVDAYLGSQLPPSTAAVEPINATVSADADHHTDA